MPACRNENGEPPIQDSSPFWHAGIPARKAPTYTSLNTPAAHVRNTPSAK